MTRSEARRRNLAALVAEHSQAGVADGIGRDRNQVYQWMLDPSDKASRNIGDRSAALIEDAFGKPRGWLDHEQFSLPPAPSQVLGLDLAKLQISISFLESQFALWGRQFIASERSLLIAAVYERLTAASPPSLIELSQWLADQVKAEVAYERESKTRRTG